MDLNQQQGRTLIQAGLVSVEIVQRAYQTGLLGPGRDLCAVLLEHSLISRQAADWVRATIQPGAVVDTIADAVDPALTSTARLSPDEQTRRASERARIERAYSEEFKRAPLFAPHAEVAFAPRGKLGEGGMAQIIRIEDRRIGRQAALKILRDQTDDDINERFLREARIMARLDHPSIAPLYEAGETAKGEYYILMKLIEGETLRDKVLAYHHSGRKDQDLQAMLEALVKVGEALSYAHSRGVIHRDLKPENIMIGTFGEVTVLDWGLARDLGEGQRESRLFKTSMSGAQALEAGLTDPGDILGTAGYMAPEQATGEPVNARADVFALGAVLCEILTEKPPVLGTTAIDRLRETIRGRILRPRQRRSDVPLALDKLCVRALEPRVEQRLSSAQDFVINLKAYLSGRPMPLLGARPLRSSLRALRHAAAPLLAIVGLAALGYALHLTRLWEEPAPADPPASPGGASPEAASSSEPWSELTRAAVLGDDLPAVRLEADRAVGALAAEDSAGALALGRVFEELGDWPRAASLYDRASADPRRLDGVALARFRLRLRRGTIDRAELLEPLMSLPPDRDELGAAALLAAAARALEIKDDAGFDAALERLSLKPPEPGLVVFLRFERLRSANRWAEAEREARRLARLTPNWAASYYWLGRVQRRLNRSAEAIASLDEALRLDERLFPAYIIRGSLHLSQNELDKAGADFKRANELDPREHEPLYGLGLVAQRRKRNGEALAFLDRAIALKPQPNILVVRAEVLTVLERYPDALRDLDRALALDPEHARVHLIRGQARYRAGDTPGALADLAVAIERRPSFQLYTFRADIYQKSREPEKADADVDAALLLAGRDARRLLVCARLKARLRRLAAALRLYDQLLAVLPENSRRDRSVLMVERAQVKIGLDQHAEAAEDCERALALQPRYSQAYLRRAQAREALGQKALAIADARRVLQLSKSKDEQDLARQLIERLEKGS